MKKVFLFLGLLSLLIVIGISCNRPEPSLAPVTPDLATDAPYQGSISVEEAQSYFTNTVLKTTQNARKADEKLYERAVDWSTARKVKQANGLEVIVSPVNYKNDSRPGLIIWDDKTAEDQKKPEIDNVLKASEVLLTFKDKTGQLQTQLVQYLPSKEYRKKKKVSPDNKDFSGWVIVQTWGEKLVTGYEYKDGKDIKRLVASDKAPGARRSECYLTYIGNVSVVCYPCGSNCTQCDATVTGSYSGYCTNPSSDSGTGSSGVNYGGSGGGGYYVPAPADYNTGINCTSFVFTKTSTLWQEAGVKGFYMNIVYWTDQRRETRRFDIPGQVVIGMPLKRPTGQTISSGQAATIAAYIVANASDQTFLQFRDREGMPSDWEVERAFRNNLNSAASAMGVGANASTNGSGSPLILIKQSEFTFFGTGSCDNN